MEKTIKKFFYTFSVLAVATFLAVSFVPRTNFALADSFTVGNSTASRSQVDSASNFTVIDTNNQVTMAGQITSFGYYAANTNPFRFVVVSNSNNVKYVSPQITPSSTGVKTYTPSSPISVSSGDRIGLYFASTGTIPYENTGAPASWTTTGSSGVPSTGSTLSFAGSGNRTYSFVAYGTTTSSSNQDVVIGNSTVLRSQIDGASNFTVIDTNNLADSAGQITSFGYYAANTNPFRFVVVNSSNVVQYVSPQITPSSIGVNTYTPSSPITIGSGYKVGLYFASTGTIPYENTGASASWTTTGSSGVPGAGTTLSFAGSGNRTYSFVAYGTTDSSDDSEDEDFPGFVYGRVNYTAGGLTRFAAFFASSNDSDRPYLGSGMFVYRDTNNNWYNVSIRRVAISDDDVYFAGRVTSASNPSWRNQWLYAKVHDGGSSGDQIWGSFVSGSNALMHFTQQNNLTNPTDGPFNITNGNILVVSSL